MCLFLPREARIEVRVEALRGEGVERDVEGVRVVKHPQIIGRRGRPRRGERAVPALVARYVVISRTTEKALGLTELKLDPHHGLSVVAAPLPPSQTVPRPGEDAVCLALLDQAYPLRTAHHLARKHPVRFVMLVVYAAGLLFIFLMKRQD